MGKPIEIKVPYEDYVKFKSYQNREMKCDNCEATIVVPLDFPNTERKFNFCYACGAMLFGKKSQPEFDNVFPRKDELKLHRELQCIFENYPWYRFKTWCADIDIEIRRELYWFFWKNFHIDILKKRRKM